MGYLICAWVILSTEIVVLLKSSIFAAVALGSGVITITIVTVLIYKARYIAAKKKTGIYCQYNYVFISENPYSKC